MPNRRRLNTGQKVREMRFALGGRRAVIEVMESGSVSSLKRWERRECSPISAHVKVVGDAYDMWLLMKKAVRKRLQRH
ncbi:MAG: hypothetical protein HZB99_04640 [Candidatus Harrisonbacteria bacterium]|nr:hypothetical protein [Candidatus Harrisonbacteria bacterium]